MHVAFNNDVDRLFYNYSTSSGGSIRKAPNAVSFVFGLRATSYVCSDAQSTLAKWNAKAPKPDRIIGSKAATVKNVMNLEKDDIDALQDLISEFGWDKNPLTEDALSSKKIYPGYVFKSSRVSKTSPWARMRSMQRRGDPRANRLLFHGQP